MSDRACIGSNGERKPRLSAIDLISCCNDCQGTPGDGLVKNVYSTYTPIFSCQGGYAFRAWIFYTNRGLVTGGPFGSNKGCKPYLFGASNSPMEEGTYHSPQCTTKCQSKKGYYDGKLKCQFKVPTNKFETNITAPMLFTPTQWKRSKKSYLIMVR
jgi:hypothetical protein